MAEPREERKTSYSSNLGGVLDGILNQGAANIRQGISGETAAPAGAGASALESILGPGFDPAQILGAGGGIDPVTGQPMTEEPLTVQELLLGTSMDVTGRRALTTTPLQGLLPTWAQKPAQRGVFNDPGMDPYLGIINEAGDERVYMGDHPTPRLSWDEFDDLADVNAKDPRARADAREHNQRIDRQNKVERQLGEDPEKQTVTKKGRADKTQTVTQVKNQPFLWEQEEIVAAMKRMRVSGLPVESFDDLVSAWGSLVDRAASSYSLSAGQKKVTPWDVLDMYKSEAKAVGSYTNFQERMNGSQTVVNKSVAELTEGQAFTVLQSNMSQMLGRDPNDEEIKDYLHRMNSMAARNPSITRTIQRYKNGEVVSTRSENDPGFTADDMTQDAYEDIQRDDEYGEYQAATLYFNAAQQALGALGQG
jgi:hypothetical protein